jgi:hypothetical protein
MISRIVFVLLASFAFVGCESARHDFSAGVREKFTGPTYVARVFTGETQAVFEAARLSAEQLGFRITRAGAAQGVIEGVSGIDSDDRLRGSRQRTLKVRLAAVTGGGTEVEVLFTEIVEDDFDKGVGRGTETTLRNHPIYESFFGQVAQALTR